MATIAPATFAHGDLPDAAEFNTYSTALTAIHDAVGDVIRSIGSRHTYTTVASGQQITRGHSFVHFYRYLAYSGTSGTIEDPTGIGAAVTLPDEDGTTGVYDLSNVSWLFYGKIYRVEGATLVWCQEWDITLL